MIKLVTVGIPVYKRLDYLPQVLNSVHLQDYPSIEVIISDNGMNGSKITDIANKYISGPYRFRQNSATVTAIEHFNQIIKESSGEYFVLLSDDDEISSNYISALVGILDSNPQVSIAFSKQEVIDRSNNTLSSSNANLPPIMSGEDFIRAWCSYKLVGFKCFLTNMTRTSDIRNRGGYPDFPKGIHSDNALAIKLCLNGYVAFSQQCIFRYRVHESSLGLSADYQDLAEASYNFLDFLDSDPRILEFALAKPDQWDQLKRYLLKMTWETYFGRWKTIYAKTLPPFEWIRAAFALPFIPGYYKTVASTLIRTSKAHTLARVKDCLPWAHKVYRSLGKTD